MGRKNVGLNATWYPEEKKFGGSGIFYAGARFAVPQEFFAELEAAKLIENVEYVSHPSQPWKQSRKPPMRSCLVESPGWTVRNLIEELENGDWPGWAVNPFLRQVAAHWQPTWLTDQLYQRKVPEGQLVVTQSYADSIGGGIYVGTG
jgi:hypothetical protein